MKCKLDYRGQTTWTTDFELGSKVYIDGDTSIKAVVVGHLFRENFHQVNCEWFANGVLQDRYFEEWRLEPAE